MKYYCIEQDFCGFSDQTDDLEKYAELVCPICYSPLLPYREDEDPDWVENIPKID